MKKIRTILICVLIAFLGNYFLLSLLPKIIANIFNVEGTITNKYLIGILVRTIGLIITIIIIKKVKIKLNYNIKINKSDLIISWLFFIYIFFNIELIDFSKVEVLSIFLMIIDALFVGFFEEFLFRGLILNLCIKEFNKSKIIIPILISSLLFGLIHFLNLTTNDITIVTYQVLYATIIGISFSSLLVRTNYNILWCSLLHGLYDIGSGFTDLIPKNNIVSTIDFSSILIGILTFVPLLIYSIYLVRKEKELSISNR
ncbi:MAG: CPBP family intramembrane metalloprotease [Bacilli bacterium]|nr:CPBP family intramembrane metalloprotease [Bacilli bacterium]